MTGPDTPNENFLVARSSAPADVTGYSAQQSQRLLLVRETSQTNNFRDYLSIIFKHKVGIIVGFFVLSVIGCVSAVAYKTWFYAPKFEAKSSLLVKVGWENFSPDLSPEKRQGPSLNHAEALGSEIRILESRDLKEKVISLLKPEGIFPELAKAHTEGLSNNEAALLLMEKQLVISPARRLDNDIGASVIDVIFDASDPSRAAAVVNQLVNCYIDKRSEIYRDPKTILFLEKKADEYRQKLAESEDRLKAFHDETKIISFDEQRTILLKRRAALEAALNGAADGIQEAQERIAELEKQLSILPKTGTSVNGGSATGDVQSKLLSLQLQEKEMLLKYKEDTPMVANIREQIAMVEQFMKKKSANIAPADPLYLDIQKQIVNNKAEMSVLKVRYTDTEKQLAELSAEIQSMEALENRNKELLREASDNEEKYHSYQQRVEEAKVYDELNRQKMTSVSVIEPAAIPIVPVNPKPLSGLIAIAFAGAIVGSLGIVFVREFSKQVMSTAMEAERRLDLPVLVTIPIKN